MSPRKPHDRECALLRTTRELLKKSEKTTLQIYMDTNLQPGWLDAVRKGTTKNPSVNRIQHLYEYLSQQKLSV